MNHLKPLPHRVPICGIWYKVVRVRRVSPENGPDKCRSCGKPTSDYGETKVEAKELRILRGIPRATAWISLIHEIQHALDHETNPSPDWCPEIEDFISRTDAALFGLLHEFWGVGK